MPERLLLTYKAEDAADTYEEIKPDEEEPSPVVPDVHEFEATPSSPPPPEAAIGDLLGLSEVNPDASAIEESNALALAIVPSSVSNDSGAVQAKDFDPSGWELALVTAPSNNNTVNERQLAGGLDTLTLNSLYDDAAYRQQRQPTYGGGALNPFEMHDPFIASSNIAAPRPVQMAAMAQQQQHMTMGMAPNPFSHHAGNGTMAPSNPFGDPTGFGSFPAHCGPHHQNNPFGSTGLL